MNQPAPSVRHRPPPADADWILDLALQLAAVDVASTVARTSAGLDLTVTVSQPGGMTTEIVVDEARYAELHWWAGPRDSPGDVAAVCVAALAAVTGPAAGLPDPDRAQGRRPALPAGPDD